MEKTQETFGQRLAAARKRRKLTQVQAAQAAGLSQGYWSELESDRNDPGLSILRRIAVALDLKLGKLLD